MGAILALFGNDGFRIPLSLLIDADVVSVTAAKLGVPEAGLVARSVWVSDPDLEAEYVAAVGAGAVWEGLQRCGMYTSNELGLCAATGSGGTRTDADVAAFCRRKGAGYKVRAAMVVAGLLTPETARKVRSINMLLGEFASAA